MKHQLEDTTRRQGRSALKPDNAGRDRKPTPRLLVEAKLAVDGFFERGFGGQAAGLLADARFALWRRSHPQATYADFYAHRANLRLERGGAHKTLGLRHYEADPVQGAVAHLPEEFATRGRRYFKWFHERALRPDMVCVDYGCGSLRVGQHFIRHLDPGCYIGLDVIDRFYVDGLKLLGAETVAAKRPYLRRIDPKTLEFVARRNPNLIYSTAVLQHVPPRELEDYFRAILSMMGPRCVAVMNFKRTPATRRIGSSAWTQSAGDLIAAALRAEPDLRHAVLDDDRNDDPSHRRSMLVISRASEAVVSWLVPEFRLAEIDPEF